MNKLCNKCGESKPHTEEYFLKSKRSKTGLTTPCRDCHKKRMKSYNKIEYHKHRDYYMTQQYKWIDARKNLTNDLDSDWFKEHITSKPCSYCNTTSEPIGADRLDNDKPHNKDNVIPCCKICNKVRNNIFTHEEMKLLGQTISRIKADR